MSHHETDTERDLLEMDTLLNQFLNLENNFLIADIDGLVSNTVPEPVTSVSKQDNDNTVLNDILVQPNPTIAAPDMSQQYVQLQPMNCQPGAFFSSQVRKCPFGHF